MSRRNRNRATVTLPTWPTSPALTNITSLSSLVVTPPWNYRLETPPGDPRESLARFLGVPVPDDIDERAVGDLQDMVDVHHNVSVGSQLMDGMLMDLIRVCRIRGVEPNPRLLVSARLVSLGVSQVTSAHVLHFKAHKFYQASALALVRTGIELIGRGGSHSARATNRIA